METIPSREKTENWTRDYSTYFWGFANPFEMKFDIEKITRVLLTRDTSPTTHLTYSGSDIPPVIGHDVRLSLEAALPKGNWYSLQLAAWVPRTWYTEAEFRLNADRTFESWVHNLQTAPSLGLLTSASQELYDQRVHQAADEEARLASQKEDQAPVTALKHEILAELRNGKSFRTAHHEGGTAIYFDGKTFVRSEYGETESLRVLGTEEETLDCIKELYDWESRKASFPHRPPDLEVWQFIQRQMV
ncbi:MAG: hypothetical protein OK456_02330 [Thaumarchaeota archaeon]|nr:hypothetical protein [Nitrososphaerota archaeon]